MESHHLGVCRIHGVEVSHTLEEDVDVHGVIDVGPHSLQHYLERLQDPLCLRPNIGSCQLPRRRVSASRAADPDVFPHLGNVVVGTDRCRRVGWGQRLNAQRHCLLPVSVAIVLFSDRRGITPFPPEQVARILRRSHGGDNIMQLGIHLPHAGEQATPALIRRHAIRAEAPGAADVAGSGHIIVPRKEFPRSPLFYDPVVTLSYVAAVTERVRLGTTGLVLPMRHPLPLAKELASLHNLSNGRLILGAGVGWLEPEFAALGVPFKERGRRMDEGIAMMRAVWTEDPVTFEAKYIPAKIADMTMLPQPVSHIPLWIGGSSDAALKRT